MYRLKTNHSEVIYDWHYNRLFKSEKAKYEKVKVKKKKDETLAPIRRI